MSDAPETVTPANETRGEITLTLGDVEYALRPSYTAIQSFEAATGKGIMALFDEAKLGTMSLENAAKIVTHCIRAQGNAIGDPMMANVSDRRIGELIVEADGGIIFVRLRILQLLLSAAGGGYTAKGEVKATTTEAIPAVA